MKREKYDEFRKELIDNLFNLFKFLCISSKENSMVKNISKINDDYFLLIHSIYKHKKK